MPVFRGTYVEALRECLQAQKPLLVYLHSDLHQDSDLFLRTVLASSELSQLVQSLGLLLWVGSAHEADGFEAATRFDATGYPYLGLLAPAPSSSVGGQAQYVRHWTSTGLTTAAEISSHVRSATLEFRSTTERARATVAARVRHRDLVDEQQR